MAEAQADSWVVTDEFRNRVKPLVQQPVRDADKQYVRGRGVQPSQPDWSLRPSSICCERAVNGRHCPANALAVPARCIRNSCSGPSPGSSRRCERPVLPNTTSFRASLGRDKALTGRCSRHPWTERQLGKTRRIGGKRRQALPVGGRAWRPLKKLVDYSRANPIALSHGLCGVNVTNTGYKGCAPALTDVVGGHVQLAILSANLAASHIKSGKLNGIGVSTATRYGLNTTGSHV